MAGTRFTVTFESDTAGVDGTLRRVGEEVPRLAGLAVQRQAADIARLAGHVERLRRTVERPAPRLMPGRPESGESDVVGSALGVMSRGSQAAYGLSTLARRQSEFLRQFHQVVSLQTGAWDLFKGAGAVVTQSHHGGGGILGGLARAAKGLADIGGAAAEEVGRGAEAVGSTASKVIRAGGGVVSKVVSLPAVRIGLRVADHASPIYDAWSLYRIARSPAIKGTLNKVATVADATISGIGTGISAGFASGELVDPAGGGIPGAIIGGTALGLAGLGVGLKAAMRTPPRASGAAGRSGGDFRTQWLGHLDDLVAQTRRGTRRARETARSELSYLSEVVKHNGRQLAGALTEPFTRPLANSIHTAGTLSRGNVAAVINQFRQLSPQMRQVTATALRDQVATMEAHRQVLKGTTRALVASINSEWPSIEPASQRAVTSAIMHMSSRMADGRRVLNPDAAKLADGIRSAMQGPFGGIVQDFGHVVSGLVSSVNSGTSAVSHVSYSTAGSHASSPPRTYRRQARKFFRALHLDGSSPFSSFHRGGLVPSLVSPGERIVHRDHEWIVPGARTAADNVLAMLPFGAAVLTDHGQSLMAAGIGLDAALAHQLPHFARGGRAGDHHRHGDHHSTGGASFGYTVRVHLGQLVHTTRTAGGAKQLARAMRELRRALGDTEDVSYGRLQRLGGSVRRQVAELRRGGRRRLQVKRLSDDLNAIEHEMDRRIQQISAQAQHVFDSSRSTPDQISRALGSQHGRRTGLYQALDRARSRHDRNSARRIRREIAQGRRAYQRAVAAQQAADHQRQYDQADAGLALDDLALSANPDDPAARNRKLQDLQSYRSLLSGDLARAQRANDYAAITDLAARLQDVGASIRDLTDATQQQQELAQQRMDLDRELADNQRRMLAVAESQPNVLLGGLIAAINGGIGGRVGLGFQTPGFAGQGARY